MSKEKYRFIMQDSWHSWMVQEATDWLLLRSTSHCNCNSTLMADLQECCWPIVVTDTGTPTNTQAQYRGTNIGVWHTSIYSIDKAWVSSDEVASTPTHPHIPPHTLHTSKDSQCVPWWPGLGNQKWFLAHTEQQTHGHHLYRKYLAVKCTVLISDKRISEHIMCNTSIQYNFHRTLAKELYKTQQAATSLAYSQATHTTWCFWIPLWTNQVGDKQSSPSEFSKQQNRVLSGGVNKAGGGVLCGLPWLQHSAAASVWNPIQEVMSLPEWNSTL